MTPTSTVIRTPIIEKIIKLSFKVVKVVGLVVVVVAIREVKLLALYQPLESTIYTNLIHAIIAKICVSIVSKPATEVTNAPTLRQKTSCYWQHFRASN